MVSLSILWHAVSMCPYASKLCTAKCETHHCRWPSLTFACLYQPGGMSKVVGSYASCLRRQSCACSSRC